MPMTVNGASFIKNSKSTINSLRLNDDIRSLNIEPEVNSASKGSPSKGSVGSKSIGSNESFTYIGQNPSEIFPYLKKTRINVELRKKAENHNSIHSYSSLARDTQIQNTSIELKRDKIRDVKISTSKFFEGMTL